MEIILTQTFDHDVQAAIKAGKEYGCLVRFIRDGQHGTDDLNVILTFQEAGFEYHIGRYYEIKYQSKDAVEVVFRYAKGQIGAK